LLPIHPIMFPEVLQPFLQLQGFCSCCSKSCSITKQRQMSLQSFVFMCLHISWEDQKYIRYINL